MVLVTAREVESEEKNFDDNRQNKIPGRGKGAIVAIKKKKLASAQA